jgi:hypothetical protein
MSHGPQRLRKLEMERTIRALQEATGTNDVCVEVRPDGSYLVSGKSPDRPPSEPPSPTA